MNCVQQILAPDRAVSWCHGKYISGSQSVCHHRPVNFSILQPSASHSLPPLCALALWWWTWRKYWVTPSWISGSCAQICFCTGLFLVSTGPETTAHACSWMYCLMQIIQTGQLHSWFYCSPISFILTQCNYSPSDLNTIQWWESVFLMAGNLLSNTTQIWDDFALLKWEWWAVCI